MTSSLSLGSYTGDSTRLARVDARVKTALLVVFTTAIFASSSWFSMVLWFAILAACLVLAGVSYRTLLCALKPVTFILAFTLLANLISCDGNPHAVAIGVVRVNVAGGLRGFRAIVRIVLLVGFTLCVSSSTTAPQLCDGIVRLLRPCARLGLPVGQLGTVLSLALRFIPLVGEELSRIRMAQRARGVSFDRGNVFDRISVWVSVFAPLLSGLFRRADQIAAAMTARCYPEGSGVSIPAPRALGRADCVVLVVGCIVSVLIVGIGWL